MTSHSQARGPQLPTNPVPLISINMIGSLYYKTEYVYFVQRVVAIDSTHTSQLKEEIISGGNHT